MSDFRTLEKNPTINLFSEISEYKPEYQRVLCHCEKTTDGFKLNGYVAVWWGRIGTNNTYRHVFYSYSGVVIGSFDHPGIIVSGGEEIDPKRLRRQIEDKIRKEFDMRIGMLIGMGSELNIL